MPLIRPPRDEEIRARLGPACYRRWQQLTALIEGAYEMEQLWAGAKGNVWEHKYRRGGKTLCALYLRDNTLGFMVIYGRAEQQKFEERWSAFAPAVTALYEAAQPYHDGRWIMVEMEDDSLLSQVLPMLQIKRRPNRKAPV